MAEQCVQPPHHAYHTCLGVVLCLGTFVSYLPQCVKIVSRRSSEGYSPYFLLLGTVSGFGKVNNIILLQLGAFLCCPTWGVGSCLINTLGTWQIFIQWSAFFAVFVLYYLYFPGHLKDVPSVAANNLIQVSPEWAAARVVGLVVVCLMTVTTAVSVAVVTSYGPQAWVVRSWAGALGIASLAIACLQYVPQIWKTWHRRSVGALSIPAMLLQTPGGYLFAYSIYVRPGANWTSWISYVLAASLQGVLLVLCIAWNYRDRRRETAVLDGHRSAEQRSAATERSTLLTSDRP
ncbi:hypothetical protein IWQ60_000206 [Tieghemiomyces parasiticus]|uniref:PQ loop repeat protein n=1 Tax=Tieghemiomyces parasiticus TaxID=78921 RepID=A0A9W8AM26_9FUNG|nr:hypothetical protein IWQ60_000206 [Tieghemiomyces parasiticus]